MHSAQRWIFTIGRGQNFRRNFDARTDAAGFGGTVDVDEPRRSMEAAMAFAQLSDRVTLAAELERTNVGERLRRQQAKLVRYQEQRRYSEHHGRLTRTD